MMLLACYGDDQLKNKVVEKLVDQEIGLQESIRIQGYSSAEIRDRVRKFLAWFIPILFSTFVLGLVIILVGKSAWGWSVDDLAIETLTSLIKWSFGGLVATIVLYYFPSKESLKRLFDRKQQTDVR
ncbi:MAG: hypothetical protein KDC26_08780 [Armatimonadetes bacterium]|nr:hypothetical protein [Armatimonadota bacterium]